MTTKEYLRQIARLDTLIKITALRYDETFSKAVGVSSPAAGDKVQTSPKGDKFGHVVDRLIELEQAMDEETDRLIDAKRIIIDQIKGLEDAVHIELLYRRYVLMESWSTIADALSYGEDYTRRGLHSKALAAFRAKYGNKYRRF